jgi:hypothetical protein
MWSEENDDGSNWSLGNIDKGFNIITSEDEDTDLWVGLSMMGNKADEAYMDIAEF